MALACEPKLLLELIDDPRQRWAWPRFCSPTIWAGSQAGPTGPL